MSRSTACYALAIALFITWGDVPLLTAQEPGWTTYEKCPVMVEQFVEVPAQERGVITSLKVEQNQAVDAGMLLAELDTALAQMELNAKQLEHRLAAEVARDQSNIEYHRLAHQKAEEELASHRSIGTSASESELRRLTFGVFQAKWALDRALLGQKAAEGEAQLKKAAVEVAELHLARRRIQAPMSGIVTALKVHPGQFVEIGQPIMEIRNLEHMIVDRLVPISQVNVAQLAGAEVRIDVQQSDGSLMRLSGSITSYDPEVSSGGLVRVHARVKNVKKGNEWLLLKGEEVTMHVAMPAADLATPSKASFTSQR